MGPSETPPELPPAPPLSLQPDTRPAAPPTAQSNVAPGWYPEPGSGTLRWWNGVDWGPYSPDGFVGPNRTAATIAHLGFVLGGFVVPLIIYLVTDKSDGFTRDAAREALNFQLTYMIVMIPGAFAMFILGAVFAAIAEVLVVIPILVGICALIACLITSFAWGITGAVRVSRGEQYRYPLCIRLINER